MSALALFPTAVRIAGGTQLSQSQYFGLALLGADIVGNRLFKVGTLLEKIASRSDAETAQEMVDRMRADVARDTGRLFNGIGYSEDDGEYTVEASAVRERGADYAGFVERGTEPGERGRKISYVADSSYHDLTAGIGDGATRGTLSHRSRRQYRGHPGTDPQPFFFQNAVDVLRERRADLENVTGLLAAEGDFQ